MKEDKRIERSNQQQQSHENHGEVDSCCRHEPLVKPIEGKENDGEERMSRNLEINLLVRHEDERPHIVAGHLEVVVEDEPEATFSSVQKALAVLHEQQCVESCEDEQGRQGQPSLRLSYLKDIVHCCNYPRDLKLRKHPLVLLAFLQN